MKAVVPIPKVDVGQTGPEKQVTVNVSAEDLFQSTTPAAEKSPAVDAAGQQATTSTQITPAQKSPRPTEETDIPPSHMDISGPPVATEEIRQIVAGIENATVHVRSTTVTSTGCQTVTTADDVPLELRDKLGRDTIKTISRWMCKGESLRDLSNWAHVHATAMTPVRIDTLITVMQAIRWKGAGFTADFLSTPAADICLTGTLGRVLQALPPPPVSSKLSTLLTRAVLPDLSDPPRSPITLNSSQELSVSESEEENEAGGSNVTATSASSHAEATSTPKAVTKSRQSVVAKVAEKSGFTEDYIQKLVAEDIKKKQRETEQRYVTKSTAPDTVRREGADNISAATTSGQTETKKGDIKGNKGAEKTGLGEHLAAPRPTDRKKDAEGERGSTRDADRRSREDSRNRYGENHRQDKEQWNSGDYQYHDASRGYRGNRGCNSYRGNRGEGSRGYYPRGGDNQRQSWNQNQYGRHQSPYRSGYKRYRSPSPRAGRRSGSRDDKRSRRDTSEPRTKPMDEETRQQIAQLNASMKSLAEYVHQKIDKQ
jgi:hypothetical protein